VVPASCPHSQNLPALIPENEELRQPHLRQRPISLAGDRDPGRARAMVIVKSTTLTAYAKALVMPRVAVGVKLQMCRAGQGK